LVDIPVWAFVLIATVPAGVSLVLGIVVPLRNHKQQVTLQQAENLNTQNQAALAEVREFRREPLRDTRTQIAALIFGLRTIVDDVSIIQDLGENVSNELRDEKHHVLIRHRAEWRLSLQQYRLALISTGDSELSRLSRVDLDPVTYRFNQGLGSDPAIADARPAEELREVFRECLEVSQRIIGRVEDLAAGTLKNPDNQARFKRA